MAEPDMLELDRWAVARASQLTRDVIKAYFDKKARQATGPLLASAAAGAGHRGIAVRSSR